MKKQKYINGKGYSYDPTEYDDRHIIAEAIVESENRLFTFDEIRNEVLEVEENDLIYGSITQVTAERYNHVSEELEKRVFYISTDLLFLFWDTLLANELNSTNKEICFAEFWDRMEIAFFNFYGLNWEDTTWEYKHGSFDSIYFYNDAFSGYDDVPDEVFSVFLTSEYNYKNDSHDKYYIKKYSNTEIRENTFIGLKSWFSAGIASPAKVILKRWVIIILKKSNTSITLDNLVFRLNISDFKCGLPKPYKKELILEIINENKERFLSSPNGDITLIDETEFLPKYFFENRELLTNFNFSKPTSGILAFSYLGNKFPLNEAEEYVNVRPVIHLALVKNLKEEFPKLISDITENEEFTPQREFMFFLKAVLPEDASVEEWLNENIAVSFYEEDAQELKLVMPKIIGHLSPVFNLAQNPGHLFEYTLKEKVKTLAERLSKKETPAE